jgi:hypothetical protein
MDRNQASICAAQVEFAFRCSLLSIGKKRLKSTSLRFRNLQFQSSSDDSPCWPAQKICKTAIAVEHNTISGQSRRAFAHGLHQHAIVGFAAFESDQVLASMTGDHQSIDFSRLYGAKSLLRSFKPCVELCLLIRRRG